MNQKHFDNVLPLNKKNISFEVDDKLVRGLDYYNKTVFEYVDIPDRLKIQYAQAEDMIFYLRVFVKKVTCLVLQ